MKPGRYSNLNIRDYHAGPGISKSGLDLMARAPALYKAALDAPRAETKAMRIGSALHKMVLEPDTFSDEFAAAPEINRRTNAGKAEYEAFCAASAGKTVLDAEEMETAFAMADSVRGHKAFGALMAPGEAEVSFFWTDPDTGALCKCRPDYLRNDGYIIDIKTTEDASPEGFARSAEKYRYYVQAAFYREGVSQATKDQPVGDFIFIAVEKSPPYLVACYYADRDMIIAGDGECRRLLRLYAECEENDAWPGYPEVIMPLSRPRWAARNDE